MAQSVFRPTEVTNKDEKVILQFTKDFTPPEEEVKEEIPETPIEDEESTFEETPEAELEAPVEEFIDTYNHEKNHVEMHMCKEFGIDPYSEEAAYLSGQLAKKLFRVMLKSLIK